MNRTLYWITMLSMSSMVISTLGALALNMPESFNIPTKILAAIALASIGVLFITVLWVILPKPNKG